MKKMVKQCLLCGIISCIAVLARPVIARALTVTDYYGYDYEFDNPYCWEVNKWDDSLIKNSGMNARITNDSGDPTVLIMSLDATSVPENLYIPPFVHIQKDGLIKQYRTTMYMGTKSPFNTSNSFVGRDCIKHVFISPGVRVLGGDVSDRGTFDGCGNLETIDMTGVNMENVKSLVHFFGWCNKLQQVRWGSNFKPDDNRGTFEMFRDCTSLTDLNEINLSSIDTSEITSLNSMFSGCTSLSRVDLSGLDFSSVTDMDAMFIGCTDSLQSIDLSNCNLNAVEKFALLPRDMYSGKLYKKDTTINYDIKKWKFSVTPSCEITFHYKNGDEIVDVYSSGSKIDKPEDPVWTGHTFGGWYKDGIYDESHRWDFDNDTVTSDMTLYAKWMCTVVFFNNDGSATYTAEAIYGVKIEYTPSERDHYIFEGWYRDEKLTKKWDMDTDIVEGNISLYAKWLDSFKVSFETNGGTPIDPIKVISGKKITGVENPIKEHNVFGGWYKDKGFKHKWNMESDPVKSDMTLYAKWTPIKFKVTFIDTRCGLSIESQEVIEGDTVTEPNENLIKSKKNSRKQEIYEFGGWYKDGIYDDSHRWDFDKEVQNDLTLYAKWKEKDIDSDNDELLDAWEIDGVDTNDDGIIDLHLKEMGADPMKADIFVEVDWIERSQEKKYNQIIQTAFCSYPNPASMQIVYNAFKDSHIDGLASDIMDGINLHIDAGENSIDYVTGRKWKDYPEGYGGNAINYDNIYDLGWDGNTYVNWDNDVTSNLKSGRERVFRHAMFVTKFLDPSNKCTDYSGYSITPGDKLIVAMDLPALTNNNTAVAGTFMHELGHSLGLKHGGTDDDNYKPNYLSIMNYLFQFTGLAGTGDVTYSNYQLPDLDENRLVEQDGIDPNGVTAGTNLSSRLYDAAQNVSYDIQDSAGNSAPISNVPIDFDGNGDTNGILCIDLNGDKNHSKLICPDRDWNHLDYSSGGCIGAPGANGNTSLSANISGHNEMSVDFAIKHHLIWKEGVGEVELIGPYTLVRGKANQSFYLRVNNLSYNSNQFLLEVGASKFNDYYQKSVYVEGSTEGLSYTDIEIPVNGILESGEQSIHVSLKYNGEEIDCKDIRLEMSEVSDDDIAAFISHKEEMDFPAIVIDKLQDVLQDERVDEVYSITYDLQGGIGSGNPSRYNRVTKDFSLAAPTKTNAEFIGWTGSNGDVPQKEVVIKKGTTGDLNFVANWEWVDNPIDPDIPDNPPEGIWIKGLKTSYPYTGSAIKPEFKVYRGNTRLYLNTDYTLQYKNNTKPGTATITIKMKGNYSGSKDVTFNIDPAALETDITADAVYATYKKNKVQKPKPELYINGAKLKYGKNDLTLTYPSEDTASGRAYVDPGTYKIHIAANNKNMFKGEMDVDLVIAEKPLMKDVAIKASKNSLPYNNGNAVSPVFTLTYKGKGMSEGTDYTVSYADDHADIGKHKVTFIGNNKDYFGKKTVTFSITGKYDLTSDKAEVKLDAADLNPDGSAPFTYGGAKPGAVVRYNGVKLTAGKDYTISYINNKNIGTAFATIKGKGSYTGSVPKEYPVKARDINSISLVISDVPYSAKKEAYKKTSVVFVDMDNKDQKLKLNTDYTLSIDGDYGDAPAAGTEIKVTIQGNGNYTGTINSSYRIIDSKYDFTKAKIVVNDGNAYDYTGGEIKPLQSELQVTLNNAPLDKDSYEILGCFNNIRKGNSAYIMLRGKGKYAGVKTVKFKIGAAPIERVWSDTILNLKQAFAW